VDGVLRQAGRTRDLLRGVAELISYVTAVMTLLPGDVLLTALRPGRAAARRCEVAVSIEGIGTLTNRVVTA